MNFQMEITQTLLKAQGLFIAQYTHYNSNIPYNMTKLKYPLLKKKNESIN